MCHHIEHGCGCSCHHGDFGYAPGHRQRQFPTREEGIAQLEEYARELQAEAKGVEERIAELRKET